MTCASLTRSRCIRTLAALIGVTALAAPAPAAGSPAGPVARPTVVLVHGAFADASSWDGVVRLLQRAGYPVIAPANPLRGLAHDSAYIASVLKSIKGPVILVGHSYGGAVITNAAAGDSHVKALVYIAAFALDKGESGNGINSRFPGSKLAAALNSVPFPLPGGGTGTDLYVKPDKFRSVFVADAPAATAAAMAATQRPIASTALEDKSEAAAWKTIPSWFLIASGDQAVPPAAERFMAKRAHSHTVEINAPHAAMVAHPGAVTTLILDAARTTTGADAGTLTQAGSSSGGAPVVPAATRAVPLGTASVGRA